MTYYADERAENQPAILDEGNGVVANHFLDILKEPVNPVCPSD